MKKWIITLLLFLLFLVACVDVKCGYADFVNLTPLEMGIWGAYSATQKTPDYLGTLYPYGTCRIEEPIGTKVGIGIYYPSTIYGFTNRPHFLRDIIFTEKLQTFLVP